MLNVTCFRRLRTCNERRYDQLFFREITLPCAPPVGSYVGIGGEVFTVTRLHFTDALDAILVVLRESDASDTDAGTRDRMLKSGFQETMKPFDSYKTE